MSQVHFSDGDNQVVTGWDSMTQRFHLGISDAPTGESLYDCWLMDYGQDPVWVINKLDEMHIARPAILGQMLRFHQETDQRNTVIHLHHLVEHLLLGEVPCGDGTPGRAKMLDANTAWLDIDVWVRN